MNGFQRIPFLMRLTKVAGFGERLNDIVYGSPTRVAEKPSIVVFFGGDVQDFTENMLSNGKNKEYVKWNLENTAELLQSTFAESHIVVVKPARKELDTFSCYINFVPSVNHGIPNHTPMHSSLEHLEKLLVNVQERLKTMTEQELSVAMELSNKSLIKENLDGKSELQQENLTQLKVDQNAFSNYELKLIGFSKGCVVLNQFLHEFHYYKASNSVTTSGIIAKIKDMYWLDGGHGGSSKTWMTTRSLLETLADLGINIHVHVTPYQMEDKRRPWMKKEENIFSRTLRELGAPISHKTHFSGVEPDLDTHFNVLKVFGIG
ncbi:mitochondrial protein C2orf69 homolog isoform X1 [Leptinotarsa decemlineata]|uniref:mitochondrial protein C2orf69 homolog isoform X1 n=2 Tax=Leptinotarsa decemlineata TaxID=7539 RepID=UPI003D30598C